MQINKTFAVVDRDTDEEYLHVAVAEIGIVQIKAQPDGIVVDIYPVHPAAEPAGSTWAHINDLINH